MADLVALSNIRRAGKRVPAGAHFSADETEASDLIALGAARQADANPEPDAPTGQERTEAITGAVAQLGDGDWTTAGRPKVAAVSKLTGFDVSAEELSDFEKPAPGQNG